MSVYYVVKIEEMYLSDHFNPRMDPFPEDISFTSRIDKAMKFTERPDVASVLESVAYGLGVRISPPEIVKITKEVV